MKRASILGTTAIAIALAIPSGALAARITPASDLAMTRLADGGVVTLARGRSDDRGSRHSGDDDGTPDQGSGDHGGDDSATPGDDDGTPDQGSGDTGNSGSGNSGHGSDDSGDDHGDDHGGHGHGGDDSGGDDNGGHGADHTGLAPLGAVPVLAFAPSLLDQAAGEDSARRGRGGRSKPRIPGGSGCDDPGDILEHPECRG